MPAIRIFVCAKGVERFSTITFEPGPTNVMIEGRDVERDWVDGNEDPGVNVGQSEILLDLVTGGITLELSEDGVLTVVEE